MATAAAASTNVRNSGPTRWLVMLGLAVALLLNLAPAALAQGTSGTLPDPIDTQELDRYAARLRLSPQQKQAVHMMHDQYKQEFRTFREGEVAEFLKTMRSMQGEMVMPKREAVEDILKKIEHLTGKIAAMDNRLFDQMQTVLTDDQLALMPRVRLARQRARYAGQEMMWMAGGGRGVDLSEMVMELKDLTPEQFQAADAIVSGYETKLTTAIATLHATTANMFLDMMTAMEEMGLTEQNFEDPEAAEKVAEAMQQVWRDMTAKAMDAAAAIADLNHRTYRSLAATLPPEQARTLRNRFYATAYPEAGLSFGYEDVLFDAALKLEELTDEQRQAVAAASQEFRQKIDPVIEETVTLIDKHRREFSPFDFNSEAMQEYQQRLSQLQQQVAETRNGVGAKLNELLGKELARKATTQAMAHAGASAGAALKAALARAEAEKQAAQVETVEVDDEVKMVGQWSGDHFIPAAIHKAELNEYAAMLGITDDQKPILDQLHRTYLEQYSKVQETEIAALTQATQKMWRVDPETHTTLPAKPEVVDEIHRLRRAAMDAVRSVDEQFFADVSVALLEDDQQPLLRRVRLARERASYNRGHEMLWAWYDQSQESRIDLTELIRQQRIDSAALASIDADLQNYEQQLAEIFRTRYDAALSMQRAQDHWQIVNMQEQQEGGNPMAAANRYQELMREPTERVAELKKQVVELNRQTLDRVTAALPVDVAHALRREYNKLSFPGIYNDPLALDQAFQNALQLTELPSEQRSKLEQMAAEYRLAYTNFSDRMVELSTSTHAPVMMMGSFDAEGWRQWQEKQEALQAVQFDRRELNLRTISALQLALSEDQIKRIGGLPDPAQHDDGNMWY